MNLFILSLIMKKCASYHFDKHVIKMILECAQLLSSVHHALNPKQGEHLQKEGKIYRKTHVNHPCAQWTRAHINNYIWVCNLGLELCDEYVRRYQKTNDHACKAKLQFLLDNVPEGINRYANFIIHL